MAQLTLKTGFDVDYYLDQVGADYYLTAAGEPPGIWMGTGAGSLGLTGQVDPDTMRALYHHDVGPDGEPLATRQRKARYDTTAAEDRARAAIEAAVAALGRFVTPEEIREIELREKVKIRTQTPFYDYTLSAEKSVSLLHAGHLAAAKRARAERREQDAERHEARARAIEQALIDTAGELVALMEQRTAYVRTGHHSATTGQWRDAVGLVVASFLQHTNRDGEPNLHIQMTILNRAQRADRADDKWRALDGSHLWAERLGLAALGNRILARKLAAQGIRQVQQASGHGFDVGGITQQTMDAFSTRTAGVNRRFTELRAEYEQLYGHAPDRRALFLLRKRATIETRKAKSKAARDAEQELAAWIRHADNANVQSLETLPGVVAAYAAGHPPSEAPSEAERRKAIRIAVAEVQRQNATWTRAKLLFELDRALPGLPAEVDPVPYFEALADEALSGWNPDVEVIQIAPVPDVVDTSRLDHRKDGTSVYRRPGEARYVTRSHLDTEEWILKTALSPVPQRVGDAAAAARAAAAGDLDYHQREAVRGLLMSRRLVNCLVAPAGTGKTRTMAAFSYAWIAETGCRVIGLTTSENAARVLAGEGMTETYNIARFLGKVKDSDQTRAHVPVHEGDVLVLDEATQLATADLLRIMQIAARAGAMIIGSFDPGQVGPVEAGGMFPLIAARHGRWRLYDVRRFERAWEREASLKLREGDITALLAYRGHGHLYDGPRDRMHDEAVRGWLTSFLAGKSTLLLAGSNEEAARLARLARERLTELGQISGANEITLADGNAAGTGDLVRARLNTTIDAGGQTLSNRDTIKITGWQGSGEDRSAVAIRQLGGGRWSAPFPVPAAYLEQSAELDYAGNVFVAQGRTVDTGHLVVTQAMTRDLLYVGMTRGSQENTMYVETGPPEPGAMTRRERDAYTQQRILEAAALLEKGDREAALRINVLPPDEPGRPRAPWEAVLAQVLHKDDPLGTALEQVKAAQDLVTHPGHLIELTEAFWQRDVVPQIDEAVRQRIGPREYERYLKDPERPAFLQLLRAHEIGGRSIEDSLDAITGRSFEGARSIAGVLHGRLEKEAPPARGQTTTFAEREPGGAAPEIAEGYQAADAQQVEIGRQLAARPEEWAVRVWGLPPAEPGVLQDDWKQRAGLVGFYRKVAGITDPKQAIGPPPSGQAIVSELFQASVRALELENEQAMLAAMGRGDLEARVLEYDRVKALAPTDVTAELDSVKRQVEVTAAQIKGAREAGNREIERSATALHEMQAGQLAGLQVADAARREWAEATAGQEAAARAAARELQQRGLAEPIPVTDAEMAAASAQPREYPVIDQAEAARWRVGQTASVQAEREARAEAAARLTPVTDAEIASYGTRHAEPEPEPEAEPDLERERLDADLAEIRAHAEAAEEATAQMPDREAERAAEIDQAAIDEPVIHEPQAESSLEPSWEGGGAENQHEAQAAEPEASRYIPQAEAEADFELEL